MDLDSRALQGVRVLDFTNLLPGPFCTLELAREGAEVIKVERVDGGDPLRSLPPFRDSENVFFGFLNQGKKSIQIDLKRSKGKEIALRLASSCDVIVESFRPGTMGRLGMGYEAMSGANPAIVYASLSSYGQGNPQPGHDLNFVSVSGLLGLYEGEDLSPPPLQLGDMLGGLEAARKIAMGLFRRERTGQGCYLDVSMTDSVFAIVSPVILEYLAARESNQRFGPRRPLTGLFPCYNVYRTKDRKWVALGALEPQFWRDFCQSQNAASLADRQFDSSPQALAATAAVFSNKDFEEWERISRETRFCLTPVYRMDDLMGADFAKARIGFDDRGGAFPGPPSGRLGTAPRLGQHTREQLRQLGYSPGEISDCYQKQAVAGE